MISNWIYGIGIWVGSLELCDKYDMYLGSGFSHSVIVENG